MRKRNLGSRLLSGVLVAVMSMSLAVSPLEAGTAKAAVSSAARGETITTEANGLKLEKTVTLENDGTYTVDLAAWAEGEVVDQKVAMDIVMTIDHSGSMLYATDYEYNGEKINYHDDRIPNGSMSKETGKSIRKKAISQGYFTHSDSKTEYMKSWVTNKYYAVQYHPNYDKNGEWDIYEGYWTKSLITGSQSVLGTPDVQEKDGKESTGYIFKTRLGSTIDATMAFLDKIQENAHMDPNNPVLHRIAVTGFSNNKGGSYKGTGLFLGTKFVRYNDITDADYKTVLQDVTTDTGVKNIENALVLPGVTREMGLNTYSDIGLQLAETIFAKNPLEPGTLRKQVILFLADGESHTPTETIAYAQRLKEAGVEIYSISASNDITSDFMQKVSSNYYNGKEVGGDTNYYFSANDSASLQEVFENISQQITQTSVTFDEKTILKDIMSENLDLTDKSVVTVSTSEYLGNGSWKNPVTISANKTVNTTTEEVSVSGFNYAENYITEATSKLDAKGSKLMVRITGVEAKESAVNDTLIDTNSNLSGLYTSDGLTSIATFGQPKTELTSMSYVMDYAKPLDIASTDWNQTEVYALTSGVNGNIKGSNGLSFNGQYGNASLKTGTTNIITYEPKTTNWDGYDSVYVVGQWDTTKPDDVNTGDNVITKINVIPATSVYYEDDFVTNTSTGVVGIEYSNDWSIETSGESGKNTASNSIDDVHGWEEALSDDTGFSDGSAHKVSYNGSNDASAEFTFTGTGVDIYSRTNTQTGSVIAQLKEDGKTVTKKMIIMDNLAESGDYYQIPTLSFQNLPHGKYSVTLLVDSTSDGRSTYYLDGIRVYNPINTNGSTDKTLQAAYGNKNMGAAFTSVRNILLGTQALGNGTTTGAVFIDSMDDNNAAGEGVETTVIADYECYGPKNEVYLAKNQAIAVHVDQAATAYYLGLKSPKGTQVRANVTSVDIGIELTHASDLYYEVSPDANGYIVIENTGDDIISVTKLYTAGLDGATGVAEINEEDAVEAVYALRKAAASKNDDVEVDIDNPEVEEEISEVIQKYVKILFSKFREWLNAK